MTLPRSETENWRADGAAGSDASATASDAAVDAGSSEPVPDPFPDRGMLGKPLGDPLDPQRYVVTVEATDADAALEGDGSEGGSYRVDVDGEVLEAPDGATVASDGTALMGEVDAGDAVEVAVRGMVHGYETDGGVDLEVAHLD